MHGRPLPRGCVNAAQQYWHRSVRVGPSAEPRGPLASLGRGVTCTPELGRPRRRNTALRERRRPAGKRERRGASGRAGQYRGGLSSVLAGSLGRRRLEPLRGVRTSALHTTRSATTRATVSGVSHSPHSFLRASFHPRAFEHHCVRRVLRVIRSGFRAGPHTALRFPVQHPTIRLYARDSPLDAALIGLTLTDPTMRHPARARRGFPASHVLYPPDQARRR